MDSTVQEDSGASWGAGSTTVQDIVGASPGQDLGIKIQELSQGRGCSVQAQDSLIGSGLSLSL